MASDCWRCGNQNTPLVRDPLVPFARDRIGVCPPCASERYEIRDRYIMLGTNLVPAQIDGDVVTA